MAGAGEHTPTSGGSDTQAPFKLVQELIRKPSLLTAILELVYALQKIVDRLEEG